ncbi:lamin tail domain-containing protein [Patescibacteria group bacterium]|nr:lamin tail domain-containing protein [Patescibacteria group bacterium]
MLNILKNNLILNKKQLCLVAAFSFFFFIPIVSLAQIEITEIMYDLEIGGDTGREWIEVYNSGTEDVNLSEYRLYEAEVNHKIKSILEGGNTIINGGGYAILSDNPEKFFEDQPNFAGLVLDTSFSLKNTGEILVIRNSDLLDIDSVNYLSEWGANGDGKSLQKINGNWVASSPTLGKVNYIEENSTSTTNDENVVDTTSTTSSSSPSNSARDIVKINIKAEIDELEYLPIAGADFELNGKALGLKDEPLKNAYYLWTFGDGSKKEGQKVLHNYVYPGEYLVMLEVISGEHSTCDKMKIEVVPAEIEISKVNISSQDNFIELHNSSDNDLDISWWRIKADNSYFTLPKNTILLSNSFIKLPFDITKLLPNDNSEIQLLYPNGMIAFNYVEKIIIEQKTISYNLEKNIIVPEPIVYSVEKPREVVLDESSNNQIAKINESLDMIGPQKEEGDKKSKFPLNKWSFILFGITLVAVGGVGYATKLDMDNEKPF